MAIVQSTAIGAGRNSAGELTYRRVRGRTIASRRVTSNNSNTAAQKSQRSAFSEVQKITKTIAPWLNVSFPKTAHGSQRNNFVKANNVLLQEIKENPGILQAENTVLETFSEVLRSLRAKALPVLAGKGSASINYKVEKAPTDLNYQVISSRRIQSGDLFRVLIGLVYENNEFPGMKFDFVRVLELSIQDEQVSQLEDPYHLQANCSLIPELEFSKLIALLPPGSNLVQLITSVSIQQGTTLSTSDFKTLSFVLPVLYMTSETSIGAEWGIMVVENGERYQDIIELCIGGNYRSETARMYFLLKRPPGIENVYGFMVHTGDLPERIEGFSGIIESVDVYNEEGAKIAIFKNVPDFYTNDN